MGNLLLLHSLKSAWRWFKGITNKSSRWGSSHFDMTYRHSWMICCLGSNWLCTLRSFASSSFLLSISGCLTISPSYFSSYRISSADASSECFFYTLALAAYFQPWLDPTTVVSEASEVFDIDYGSLHVDELILVKIDVSAYLSRLTEFNWTLLFHKLFVW